MKNIHRLLKAVGLTLLLASCGGSDSEPEIVPPVAAIQVTSNNDTSFSIKDGSVEVALSAANSASENSTSLTYKWELIARPELSKAELSALTSETATFTADYPGDYVVSLIVNDGKASSAPQRMTFTATNPVPTVVTETNYSVALGTDSLGLDATNSLMPTDSTGELSYSWTLVEKPVDSAAYLVNPDQGQATLHLDLQGDYKLEVVVSLGDVSSAPTTVMVNVSEGNLAPIVSISEPAKAEGDLITLKGTIGQLIELDASESTDPEGQPLQHRWRWSYTPVDPDEIETPELTGATTSKVSFTPKAAGLYSLTTFVFDGERKSREVNIEVTIEKDPASEANQPPVGKLVATGYYPSYSIGEQEVGLRAEFNFVGYDPEGEPLQIISAELIIKPEASEAELVNIGSWKPLGKKIQKLDVEGNFVVRMVVSDGVNEITSEATMVAKIGQVNGTPFTRGVEAQAKSVIVGNALVFDASSSDPNDDPIEFHWELVDKPDGSKATIEPVIEPESQEYRRAKVVTDIPGSYTARLIVSDDRGLYSSYYREAHGFAKISNMAPEIRSVVWARNWGRLNAGEDYFQILPCMSLLHRPVLVDADGDEVFYHDELISTPPAGGDFTSYPSSEDCPDSRGQVFSKPGTYVFRYSATDLIDDAPQYDFVVNVDAFEDAKGVRLRSLNSDDESLWHPLPYENKPPYASDFRASSKPFTEEGYIRWSMTAADGDYTIENVKVQHINGDLADLTPRFEGLEEGQIIKQGESLDFQTVFPAVTCIRNDDRSEGFHFSFNIKELPEITFVYENWRTASEGIFSEWQECESAN